MLTGVEAGSIGAGVFGLLVLIFLMRDGLSRLAWRVLSVLTTVYVVFAFWFSHVLVLIIQLLLRFTVGLCVAPENRHRLLGRPHQLAAVFEIFLNPFWYLRVERRVRIPKGALVMCSHLSYVDAWVLAAALFPRVAPKFAAGQAFFQMPVFGSVMRMAGHMSVAINKQPDGKWRADKSKTAELLSTAEAYLRAGDVVAVYPEGRLSQTGELGEFKIGFFQVAMRCNAPIVPVGQWGNHAVCPPGKMTGALLHPGVVHMAFGDPVAPADFGTAEELRDHVRNKVLELRDGLSNCSAAIVYTHVLEATAAGRVPEP